MQATEPWKISTPEQIALELPIAGVGSRFLALAVDTFIQAAIYFVAFLGLVVLSFLISLVGSQLAWTPGAWLRAGANLVPALFVVFAFCVYWGYFAGFEIFWKGQTPGKRIAGIRVIKDSGRPIDVSAAVLRNLLRAIDFLPALYGAGVVCMMVNRHSRRLGDLVAGTVVVHDRPALDIGAISTGWRSDAAPPAASAQVLAMTGDEIVLIETYLDRRLELAPDVQDKAAKQIVRRIVERTGLKPSQGELLDDFLIRVVRQARDTASFRR